MRWGCPPSEDGKQPGWGRMVYVLARDKFPELCREFERRCCNLVVDHFAADVQTVWLGLARLLVFRGRDDTPNILTSNQEGVTRYSFSSAAPTRCSSYLIASTSRWIRLGAGRPRCRAWLRTATKRPLFRSLVESHSRARTLQSWPPGMQPAAGCRLPSQRFFISSLTVVES